MEEAIGSWLTAKAKQGKMRDKTTGSCLEVAKGGVFVGGPRRRNLPPFSFNLSAFYVCVLANIRPQRRGVMVMMMRCTSSQLPAFPPFFNLLNFLVML